MTATHGGCPLTCEGIGLAGNVCPVVLACSDLNGCSTTSLVGFGFNPTIVRAPEHLRRHNIEFIGTDRFEQNNKMVKCRNPNLRRYIRNNSSTARLLLLNKGLQVLHRAEIYGGRCMRPRYSAVDARLLVAGSTLYMSYANLWGDPECRGHFIARLKLQLNAPPNNQFNRLADLVSTESTGGLDVMGSPGKLLSVRNGGVLVQQNRIRMELSDIAPFTEVLTVTGKLSRFPVPLRLSTFMHNSMHPIWVPELSAFLGVVRNLAANIFAHRATHPLALSLGAFLTHFHPPVPACLIFK